MEATSTMDRFCTEHDDIGGAMEILKGKEKVQVEAEVTGDIGVVLKGKSKIHEEEGTAKEDGETDFDYVDEEQEKDDECFDTSSDEELLEARRRIKEDVMNEKKGNTEWLPERDTPCFSEDDSDAEDYLEANGGDEYGEGNDLKQKAISKMIRDEDLKNQKRIVGMRFVGPDLFREVVTRYAVLSGYPICWRKSDKRRKEARCNDDDCDWRVYASWDGDHEAFVIKIVNDEHKCQRQDYKNFQCKPSFLAQEYLARFKSDPDLKMKSLRDEVNARFGVDLKKRTFYRTQQRAKEILYGSLEEHYLKLIPYVRELKRVEPNATIELLTDQPAEVGKPHVFKRLYMSFPATRNGFLNGCRPFLCLDGTFLKSPVGGVLFAAIARDGNNQMFPVAWAVVEAENNDAWSWFLQILRKGREWFTLGHMEIQATARVHPLWTI